MMLRLFKLPDHLDRTAVSKVEGFVVDGAFFLDFNRPLEIHRWFGFAISLLVPFIHQGEQQGGYAIGVHRSDAYFADLRALWKAHYPSKVIPPITEADGLKIIADFATQFPNDCR